MARMITCDASAGTGSTAATAAVLRLGSLCSASRSDALSGGQRFVDVMQRVGAACLGQREITGGGVQPERVHVSQPGDRLGVVTKITRAGREEAASGKLVT